MAYGLLLYKEIIAPEGTHRLEVYKDGYTGSAVEIDGLVRDSIVLSKNAGEVSDAIVTSVLSFGLYDTGQIDYTQFFTPNATLFKVVLKLDGTTRWTGFLTPDSYSENLAYRDIITLTARDNLGRLNDYDFSLGRGQLLSVRNIITAGLSVAGVAMQTTFSTAKVASDPATILAVDGLVNTTLLVGRSWHEALDLLLRGLGLTLAWNEGNTFDVRDISQAPATTQAAYFINKSGFRQKRPAWKNVAVSQDFGLRDNFYEGQFSREQCGTGNTFAPSGKWEATGTMALLNPYKFAAANPAEMVFIPVQEGDTISAAMTYTVHAPSMAKAMKLVVKCSNSAWRAGSALRGGVWAQRKITTGSGTAQAQHFYFLRYSFNIFATVGSTRYILRETWEEYDPATLAEPYLYFVMPGTEGGIDEDNEVTFYLAELPGAADIEFVVYPVIAQLAEDGPAITTLPNDDYGRLSDITFTVQEGIAGRSKLITVNADHNVQSDLSFGLGAVPRSNGNDLVYLGGLFYTDADHTPIREAALAAGGTEYDLLELVAREHIGFNNDNYDLLSGQMKASAAFSFAAGILYGETAYRVISASLAVLSNTLNVQAMQTEAQFPTAAYVIGEVDESGGASAGGYSGASVPQGGFGGVDWFVPETYEVDGQTRRRLKLNPNYAGMYAEGWIVSGGQGSGSGEAGGSLATLADVTLTALAAGDILRYNATTAHWENGPLAVALSALTDVAIGTPSNGQALLYDSAAGKWKPGNVSGGSVNVVSADATIGTTLTTLGTINGVAIKAKIDNYLLISQFIASNIVEALGSTPVNRATGDASGNTIKTYYAANLVYDNGTLVLKNGNNSTLSTITGANILGMLGLQTTDTIATTAWVGQQGYLTSSAISDMATKTWVGQQGYLTSSAISDMATKTWVGQQGYATQTWIGQQGYLTSADLSGYATESWVNGKGYMTASAAEDMFLQKSQFIASNIVEALGTTPVARATADASGNTITSSYLRKDTDDTMSANLTIGSSSSTKTLMVYGSGTFSTDLTVGGNTTIGAKTSTSTAKALSVYGRNNSTNPALNIYGVYGNNSAYLSSLYAASDGLHITTTLNVAGNITATGNIVAGTASDRRLKDHIKTMAAQTAVDVLKALRPVEYEWNEKAGELGGLTGVSRGFVADEYKDIIPNATRKIWGSYDAIDYQQAIPYLVAGWQALYAEVQELKRRLGDGI